MLIDIKYLGIIHRMYITLQWHILQYFVSFTSEFFLVVLPGGQNT